MNEVLLKRLLGAGVLVVGTLILANLLPEPQVQPPPDGALTRVTYSLRPGTPQPQPIAEPPAASALVELAEAPPGVMPLPDPGPTPEPEMMREPVAPAAPAVPEQKTAPAPKPKPKPATKALAKTPEQAVPPKPASPALPTEPAPLEPQPQAAPSEPQPQPEAQLAKAEAVTTPAAATNAWFVQIGAFAQEANAAKSVQKLLDAGMSARQDTVVFKAGKRHRVRAGPYASREEADAHRAKAAGIGFVDARVARE
jgi:DedD protein